MHYNYHYYSEDPSIHLCIYFKKYLRNSYAMDVQINSFLFHIILSGKTLLLAFSYSKRNWIPHQPPYMSTVIIMSALALLLSIHRGKKMQIKNTTMSVL